MLIFPKFFHKLRRDGCSVLAAVRSECCRIIALIQEEEGKTDVKFYDKDDADGPGGVSEL